MKEKDSENSNPEKNTKDSQRDLGIVQNCKEDAVNTYKGHKQSFESIIKKQEDIINNNNATSNQKTLSVAVGLFEAYKSVKAVKSSIKGLGGMISGNIMLPILKKINIFKGMACLPVSKQTDPVLGIDVHMVTIPPSPAPIPLPHPYIGVSLLPKDFLTCFALSFCEFFVPDEAKEVDDNSSSEEIDTHLEQRVKGLAFQTATMMLRSLGASVKIGPVLPRTIAGTSTKSIPHFPIGAGFHPVYSRMVEKNHGHALLGSLFVVADSYPITGGVVHLHNSCWDIGIFSIHNTKPNKNTDGSNKKFRARLYVPSGIILPIPWLRPVHTNPVPSPINPLNLVNHLFKAGFKKLKKIRKNKVLADQKAGKACGRLSNTFGKFNKILDKKLTRGVYNKLENFRKTFIGHPVDVATGQLFTESTDFSFAGPIPLSFSRVWYSDSHYSGALGHGWHHSYDMALFMNKEHRLAQVRLKDGRIIIFDKIPTKENPTPRYHRSDKLWLCYHKDGYYYLKDQKELIYLFNTPSYANKEDAYLLSSVANTDGFAIRFKYDNKGVLQEIKDSVGRLFTVISDSQARITKIITDNAISGSPAVCIASYSYNNEGDMISHFDQMQQAMHFEYENHLMVKETWRNGHKWFFRFDGNKTGAKCIETWGDGKLLHYKISYLQDSTIAVDGLGSRTVYKHRNGLVYETIDAKGAEWKNHYNKYDELERSSDPLGNERAFLLDDFGNISKVLLPDGQFTQVDYNNSDFPYLPTDVTDARGGKWKYKYNSQGRIIETIDPLGAITMFEYTNDGLPESTISGLGAKTSLYYDRDYNIESIQASTGAVNKYRYDKWGRCIEVTNPKGVLQTRQLDTLGRAISINDFDDNIISLKYDALDNVIRYEDSNRDINFTYKGLNKIYTRSEAGKSIRYRYDSQGQLRSITNQDGFSYEFELDAIGNVVTEKGFDGLMRHYKHNPAGWLTEIRRPGGHTTKYEYDEMGRHLQINYSDNTFEKYKYEKGLLTEAINNSGSLSFSYDIIGNLIEESFNGEKVTSQYDTYSRRVGLKSSLGAHFEHTYDQWSNLIETQLNSWKTNMEYDKFGLENIREYSGGIKQEWEYDRLGRLKNQRVGKQSSPGSGYSQLFRQYVWDQGGLLRQITDHKGSKTYFQHDKRGFLEKISYDDGSEQQNRGVDTVGNLYEQLDLKDRKYIINRLEETKTAKFKYDAEGNLIEKIDKSTNQKWIYQWDAAGMLSKVVRPDKNEVNFQYDALGRRTSKSYKKTTTHYLWDGNTPLHEYKTFENRESTADDIITWVFEEDSFVPMAKIKGEKKYSIVTDHLGTPIQGFNDTGDKIWERELDTYGKVRKSFGEDGFCNYLYQGQTYDKETDLAYNRFRYYDPEQGNYISQDPIGLAGGNPTIYGYVGDVTGWVDVFGLARIPKNNGSWDGVPGNSNWFSNDSKVINITKGEGVPFNDGYPNFSKWSKGNITFNNLNGTNSDFGVVNEYIAQKKNLPNKTAGKNYLKQKGLTAHHHQDMKTIQLIPSDLHNNVPHEGGASKLRKNDCSEN